jgi:hypothetical protein
MTGTPGGELEEDGLFPVAEFAEHGIKVLLGTWIGQQGGERVDEPPCRGRGEDRVADGDAADGGEQLSGPGVFQDETAGACFEPG